MGIRPQFQIVVGIDDAKDNDPRYTPPDAEWLEEVLNFRQLTEEECWRSKDKFFDDFRDTDRELYKLLYNPHFTDEYAVKNVQGLMHYEGPYDDNIVRALAAIDDKYLTSGYERISTLDPENHLLRYSRYGYTDEDIKANRFVPGHFESMPQLSRIAWQRAKHYLEMVGWKVQEIELRYLLVWDWG